MSNDGKKSEEDGGDLERTEEKSAAELEAIVKAAEGGGSIEDEVTATGDPDEIERAALASVHPTEGEDEAPPSSEGAPVSMRDLEAEPASSRDFEPVSLHDVEVAMAPGKAPPKIPAVPPAPKAGAPRVPAAPAAKPAAPPASPATAAATGDAAKGPVFAGAAAARPKIVPRAPLKARQPSQPDAEEAGAVPPIRKRVSSIPPPLPKPGSDDALMRLSGGLSAPLLPSDLAIPGVGKTDVVIDEAEADAARARPAPPRKKKPAEPAPEAKEDAEAAKEETAPKSERAPASKRSKRTSKSPPKDEAAAAEEPKARSKRPPKSERPVAASKPPPEPAEEPAKSRTTLYLVAAAALVLVGYFAFGRGGEAPKPTDAQIETAKPKPPPETPPALVETVGTTPEPPPTQPATETSSSPKPSDSAKPTTAQTPSTPRTTPATGDPTGPTTPSTPATPPPTSKPAASAAPAVASGPFDRSAASAAMSSAVGTASGCKKEGDPSGVAHVTVTFAPSGRVTQANIGGPPFAGTPTGGCIAKAFKTAKIPPFEGDPVTVSKTVNIP